MGCVPRFYPSAFSQSMSVIMARREYTSLAGSHRAGGLSVYANTVLSPFGGSVSGHEVARLNVYREKYVNLTLNDINLLHAPPTVAEIRATWLVMGVLLVGCLVTIPFAAQQWPASHLLYAAAGVAAFSEITTGLLLLTQAMLLRQNSGLVLGMGYLLGGLVILVNLLGARDVATRLWLFRLWHGVFVLGVLAYAVLNTRDDQHTGRHAFRLWVRPAIGGGIVFIAALILYLIFRPFALPVIIHDSDYITFPNVLVNGAQLLIVLLAWALLLTARRKTVLSVWMEVVACAVAIDIVLFVLGTTLFSAGLYISKLNNLIAATLIFGVIFYRYIRIQTELHKHRVALLRANRRLARMALTDTLTGLPNRAALDQCLEQALGRVARTESRLAVCVIDLDDFKHVNDQYGHEMGDRLLCAFTKRLSSVLRKGEYFARLGGDEFVLVLEHLLGREQLPMIMKRITSCLADPFVLSPDLMLFVNASVGVALYPDFLTSNDLVRAADQALYRSKDSKTDRLQSWTLNESSARGVG